jgi:hypothetical protein
MEKYRGHRRHGRDAAGGTTVALLPDLYPGSIRQPATTMLPAPGTECYPSPSSGESANPRSLPKARCLGAPASVSLASRAMQPLTCAWSSGGLPKHLRTAHVRATRRARPAHRVTGTGSSNPFPSSGESRANRGFDRPILPAEAR